mmetsp:Transcript_19792/g.53334  ORF Transcript_19792/g.53334 Transcript_19792/m.53334 type:complete len:229 (-) Transcript_19792:51-737(-)
MTRFAARATARATRDSCIWTMHTAAGGSTCATARVSSLESLTDVQSPHGRGLRQGVNDCRQCLPPAFMRSTAIEVPPAATTPATARSGFVPARIFVRRHWPKRMTSDMKSAPKRRPASSPSPAEMPSLMMDVMTRSAAMVRLAGRTPKSRPVMIHARRPTMVTAHIRPSRKQTLVPSQATSQSRISSAMTLSAGAELVSVSLLSATEEYITAMSSEQRPVVATTTLKR